LEKLSLQSKNVFRTAVLVVTLLISGIAAGEVGGLSGAYLRPPAGATALGMGGAYSAAPDYMASWWNPAVLANMKGKRFSIGAGVRSFGRSDLYSEFEFKVPPRIGMGLLLLYRGDPFINDLYDENENLLEKASYTTITGKISVSYYFSRKFSAGLNIGIHYQHMPTGLDENNKWVYSSATGIGAFDIGTTYKLNDKFTLALIAKDFFALMNWTTQGDMNGMGGIVEDRPLPSFTLASKYADTLAQKPLIWTADLEGYLFDGAWKGLTYPEAYLSTGVEWRYWKTFFIRAGLGDILINHDIIRHTSDYFSDFPCKISLGFSLDLSKYTRGMFINYGIATDKTWAGVDQQLDMTIGF
jgi:hypothetical protein